MGDLTSEDTANSATGTAASSQVVNGEKGLAPLSPPRLDAHAMNSLGIVPLPPRHFYERVCRSLGPITQAEPAAARARARLGGRARKLNQAKQIAAPHASYDGGQAGIATICSTPGISLATHYRVRNDPRSRSEDCPLP